MYSISIYIDKTNFQFNLNTCSTVVTKIFGILHLADNIVIS